MDSRTWTGHDEAIRALSEKLEQLKKDKTLNEPYEISRNEATRICGMSPSVFGREVPMSSLFRAYYKSPRYEGKASYYKIEDLIEHFKRIGKRAENIKLICELFINGPKWFKKEYHDPDFVFAEDTYLPIGDFNPPYDATKSEVASLKKSNPIKKN